MDTAPKYLIRDNDRAFGAVFQARLRAMGVRDQPTSFRSPWQNGLVERLIGSARNSLVQRKSVPSTQMRCMITAMRRAHFGNRRWSALPKVSQQRRHELRT